MTTVLIIQHFLPAYLVTWPTRPMGSAVQSTKHTVRGFESILASVDFRGSPLATYQYVGVSYHTRS